MYIHNIEQIVKDNQFFRQVLYTGEFLQLTSMTIHVGDEIPQEIHQGADQLLYIVVGNAEARIGERIYELEPGDVLIIPRGEMHVIKNSGEVPLQLFSVYSQPQHPLGAIHKTKEDALKAEREENKRQWYE